jgi:hypothetical protein
MEDGEERIKRMLAYRVNKLSGETLQWHDRKTDFDAGQRRAGAGTTAWATTDTLR